MPDASNIYCSSSSKYLKKKEIIFARNTKKKRTYLVIPGFVIVVDDGSTKAPSRVDTSSSDRNGTQVNHEHGEPNWQRSQHLRTKMLS